MFDQLVYTIIIAEFLIDKELVPYRPRHALLRAAFFLSLNLTVGWGIAWRTMQRASNEFLGSFGFLRFILLL